ncbi:DMT family transporter [Parvibium lacunae]|uniref:DMT family transporter n=1 Tax=Parvibium lacunae TaxID=1888893 RepID=UPI001314333D|nr:DMT family transporter [Parvibium lacunae]
MALIVGATAIAFAGIFVRLAETGPIASAFWRMFLALPILTAILAWPRFRTLNTLSDSISSVSLHQAKRAAYWAGVWFAIDLILFHYAAVNTLVAAATLESNLAPIFVALGLWYLTGAAPRPLTWFGMLFALIGAVCIALPNLLKPAAASQQWLGDLAGLTSAVFYALYILALQRARQQLPTLRAMCLCGLSAAAVLFPAAIFAYFYWQQPLWPITVTGWGVVIGLALISQLSGQVVIAYAFAHLPATFSSITLLLQPVLTAVFAWLILAQQLSGIQIVGAGLVLTGIYIAKRAL